jgi:hypothetical protein
MSTRKTRTPGRTHNKITDCDAFTAFVTENQGKIKSIIGSFCRRNPDIPREDVEQQAWLIILESLQDNKLVSDFSIETKNTTFIFKNIKWGLPKLYGHARFVTVTFEDSKAPMILTLEEFYKIKKSLPPGAKYKVHNRFVRYKEPGETEESEQ